jgi:CheY-like chemotaxis protein
VLVVDDDPDSRQILQAVLEYGGAVVSVTTTARDALGVLERVRADVVLTDLSLPGEDGYWLVQHLRGWPAERGGRVPVVAMTADDGARDTILAAGFTEYVRKPIVVDRLFRMIGTLTGKPEGRSRLRGSRGATKIPGS